MLDAWTGNGGAAPTVMASDSVSLQTLDTAGVAVPKVLALRALTIPFRGRLVRHVVALR